MDLTLHKDHKDWRALLKGQFTFADNARFGEVIEAMRREAPAQIIIDVSQVSYVDSAALGMFLMLRETAAEHKTHVMIAGANGQVLKIFELSRFGELFELI